MKGEHQKIGDVMLKNIQGMKVLLWTFFFLFLNCKAEKKKKTLIIANCVKMVKSFSKGPFTRADE